MIKSFLGSIILLILFTTYVPKFNFSHSLFFKIKDIQIENNFYLNKNDILKKLNFLNDKSLFFLKIKDIEKELKNVTLIESYTIKKIYPNGIKIIVKEKVPIAILQKKKKKFLISDKGKIIDFIDIKDFNSLPTVFGGGKKFFALYQDLQNIEFPITMITNYYFFESGRWDLVMQDGKTIKLPIIEYKSSLQNFLDARLKKDFNNYKIFDYRIKDQLILN